MKPKLLIITLVFSVIANGFLLWRGRDDRRLVKEYAAHDNYITAENDKLEKINARAASDFKALRAEIDSLQREQHQLMTEIRLR